MFTLTIKNIGTTKLPDGSESAQRALYSDGALIAVVSGPMGAHCLSAIIDRMKQGDTTIDSFMQASEGGTGVTIDRD